MACLHTKKQMLTNLWFKNLKVLWNVEEENSIWCGIVQNHVCYVYRKHMWWVQAKWVLNSILFKDLGLNLKVYFFENWTYDSRDTVISVVLGKIKYERKLNLQYPKINTDEFRLNLLDHITLLSSLKYYVGKAGARFAIV